MKTNRVFLVLLVISIIATWYLRINTEKEFYDKESIYIPISVALREMKGFDESRQYRKERHIRGMKKRTLIPFVYKYDTLSVSSFMYYSKAIE